MDSAPLPDLCLLRIFSHLPPPDLFYSIPLVCRAWYRLAREASRRTRSIAIIVDNASVARFHFILCVQEYRLGTTTGPQVARILAQAFMFESLNMAFCELLVETFPNITRLDLYLDNGGTELTTLNCLLNHWGAALTRFGLWCPPLTNPIFSPESFAALINSLNRLKRLRVLTMVFAHSLETRTDCFYLKILPQLEQLDLALHCPQEIFLQALLAQGLETGPRQSTLNQDFDILEAVKLLAGLDQAHQIPLLARKFQHLYVDNSETLLFTCLATHFRHLKSLELIESQRSFRDLSGPLSQLIELHTLKLTYYVPSTTILEQLENPPPPWCPLPSVRVFMLKHRSTFTSHAWLENELNPAILLPELEYVYIDADALLIQCEACYIAIKGTERKRIQPRADCLRAILEPFNGCPLLNNRLLTEDIAKDILPVGWNTQEYMIHPWW